MEMISFYTSQKSTTKKDITILDYIEYVKNGLEQDLVLSARSEFQQNGKSKQYKFLKDQAKCVTGSAIMNQGSKTAKNISKLNGLIVLDIDEEIEDPIRSKIENDKYTYICHYSFSGTGLCVFVKINPDRFEESFDELSQYYYDTFNVAIDAACKNKNRLRYISYDPDLFYNEKAHTYKAKLKKKTKPQRAPITFTSDDDIDYIMKQINDRSIDLVKGEYARYRNIGFALFSEFGKGRGKEYFDIVNRFNSRLNEKRYDKEWKSFCSDGAITIGTFYYYCKEEGIELFTPRSREIINRVKVQKSQGAATIKGVNQNLAALGEEPMNEKEEAFAKKLIESKEDFSKEANENVPEIQQLENFIVDSYEPKRDEITDVVYIKNNVRLTDNEMNDIYIGCRKNLEFNVTITDVRSIINSNSIGKFNAVKEFFENHKNEKPSGLIDEYIQCIHPYSEYNVWAFKKWIVGAIHNWTAPEFEKLVCPLTLVLTGQKHGTGKTSFLRNCLPDELQKYFVEAKINSQDKDSQYLLGSSLMVLDDEFGGKAFKDVKEYKAVSDINMITQRRPYASTISTFKRRAILCGTSNEMDILKDVTGNRRILPIHVEKIDFDKMVNIDKIDLIIEAFNLYKSGFEWKIYSDEDIKYLTENTVESNAVIPIEEVFFNNFALEFGGDYNEEVVMNQGEIMQWFYDKTTLKPNKFEIKEIFVKNKMVYTPHRVGGQLKKGYKLYKKDPFNDNDLPGFD